MSRHEAASSVSGWRMSVVPSASLDCPLRGPDVAALGAYWNDAAINLMHGERLDIQMLLYDELLRFALENPVKWTG